MIEAWTRDGNPLPVSMPFLFLFSFLLLGRYGLPKPSLRTFLLPSLSQSPAPQPATSRLGGALEKQKKEEIKAS